MMLSYIIIHKINWIFKKIYDFLYNKKKEEIVKEKWWASKY